MALSERHKQYLLRMGIQPWALRQARPTVATDLVDTEINTAPEVAAPKCQPLTQAAISEPTTKDSIANMDWASLQDAVARCQKCELHTQRTQTVFGIGNKQAQWLVIGEAPGADEDRQGEPFVGRAGQLLNNMLLAIGLRREEVYIANILKCRPPNNRDPKPEEVAQCEAYLHRQVALIQPKIILAVGRIAAHNLLKTDSALANLRQRTFHYAQTPIPLVVTYHPAYLLRSPRDKRKAWQDLLYAVNVFKHTA